MGIEYIYWSSRTFFYCIRRRWRGKIIRKYMRDIMQLRCFNSLYQITFWKCGLWLSKSCVSITVWKTLTGSRNALYAILNGTEKLRFGREGFLHVLVFYVLFIKEIVNIFPLFQYVIETQLLDNQSPHFQNVIW